MRARDEAALEALVDRVWPLISPTPSRDESRAEIGLLAGARVLEVRHVLGALLVESPRFGRFWLCFDADEGLDRAEEQRRLPARRRLPVLTEGDLDRLEGRCPESVRHALDLAADFGTPIGAIQ